MDPKEYKDKVKKAKDDEKKAEKELRGKRRELGRDEYNSQRKSLKENLKKALKLLGDLKPVQKSAILTFLLGSVLVFVQYEFDVLHPHRHCEQIQPTPEQPRPWAFCADSYPDSTNEMALIQMPGTGSDEFAWTSGRALKGMNPGSIYNEKLLQAWGNNGPQLVITLAMYKTKDEDDASRLCHDSPVPVTNEDCKKMAKPVVLPGTMWLLEADRLKLLDTVIIPYLVAKYPLLKQKTALYGVSMGGWNAIQWLLDPQRPLAIERAYLNSPMLTTCNPFEVIAVHGGAIAMSILSGGVTSVIGFIASVAGVPSELNIFATVTSPLADCSERLQPPPKSKWYHFGAGLMIKSFYILEERYDAANPLANGKNLSGLPPIMLSSGAVDEFGFQTADKLLVSKLRAQGVPTELVEHGGNHSVIPVEKVAPWLVQ